MHALVTPAKRCRLDGFGTSSEGSEGLRRVATLLLEELSGE
jgi:hypothetical protein